MNKGFVNGRCGTGKHDITTPNAIGVDASTGRQYCKLCKRQRYENKRDRRKQVVQTCRNCNALLPIGRSWAFCNTRCQHIHRSKNAQKEDLEDARRTMELMVLYRELDMAATSWERAEIRAKIAAVK